MTEMTDGDINPDGHSSCMDSIWNFSSVSSVSGWESALCILALTVKEREADSVPLSAGPVLCVCVSWVGGYGVQWTTQFTENFLLIKVELVLLCLNLTIQYAHSMLCMSKSFLLRLERRFQWKMAGLSVNSSVGRIFNSCLEDQVFQVHWEQL